MTPDVLDMCSGSRMFWWDKADPRVVYMDKRQERHILCDGRQLDILPDVIADFRAIPFADCSFRVCVFDPPHLYRVGEKGFQEAHRVLKPGGVLVFKWNETQIPVKKVISCADGWTPSVWQRTGKNDKTHWIIFIKSEE